MIIISISCLIGTFFLAHRRWNLVYACLWLCSSVRLRTAKYLHTTIADETKQMSEQTKKRDIINALCALLKNYRDSHGWLFGRTMQTYCTHKLKCASTYLVPAYMRFCIRGRLKSETEWADWW